MCNVTNPVTAVLLLALAGSAVDEGTVRERLTGQAMDNLLAVLKRDFSKVLLVFHPAMDELESGAVPEEVLFQGVATKAEVDFLSLRQSYVGARKPGAGVYADRLHLDAGGTSLMAFVLAERLAGC